MAPELRNAYQMLIPCHLPFFIVPNLQSFPSNPLKSGQNSQLTLKYSLGHISDSFPSKSRSISSILIPLVVFRVFDTFTAPLT